LERFESRIRLGLFPHVKEVEDIGLTNQPCKTKEGPNCTHGCCASICFFLLVLREFSVYSLCPSLTDECSTRPHYQLDSKVHTPKRTLLPSISYFCIYLHRSCSRQMPIRVAYTVKVISSHLDTSKAKPTVEQSAAISQPSERSCTPKMGVGHDNDDENVCVCVRWHYAG